MSHVFHRGPGHVLPLASRARGSTIWDADGKRYLDAAGGAIVVGIGHGDQAVVDAIREQSIRIAYAHATQFTAEALERYGLKPAHGPRQQLLSYECMAIPTISRIERRPSRR